MRIKPYRYWLYPSMWPSDPLWRFINSTISTFTVSYSLMTVVDTWMRICNFWEVHIQQKSVKTALGRVKPTKGRVDRFEHSLCFILRTMNGFCLFDKRISHIEKYRATVYILTLLNIYFSNTCWGILDDFCAFWNLHRGYSRVI